MKQLSLGVYGKRESTSKTPLVIRSFRYFAPVLQVQGIKVIVKELVLQKVHVIFRNESVIAGVV